MGVADPELPTWLPDVSVSISHEGEDDRDCNEDRGVDVPDVVEATVIAGRNLLLGPLL